MLSVSFRFGVCLPKGTEITSDLKEAILDWYNLYGGSNAEDAEMVKSKFEFVDTNIIKCSYKIKETLYNHYKINGFLGMYYMSIADPDDDGNHPIDVNGTQVRIQGTRNIYL